MGKWLTCRLYFVKRFIKMKVRARISFQERIFLLTYKVILLGFLFLSNAFAYKEVHISGISRVSRDAIESNLLFSKKNYVSDKELSEELGNLYRTGFFADVSLRYENGILHIEVVEVPIVSAIKFNGLEKFKKDDVMKEIESRERSFYSKASVISDAKKLETMYKTLGVLDATVQPMIEFKEGGRVFVIFNISEGKQKTIRRIMFEGNDTFEDETLKEVLSFKEYALHRMFSSSVSYNIGQMISEMENLKRFYASKGYPKSEITKHFISLNEKTNDVDIYIFVDEGEKYAFGDVNLVDNLQLKYFKTNNVKDLLRFKKGKTYNAISLEETRYKISDIAKQEGFPLSMVSADEVFNEKDNTVNITFTINPTKRVYIGKITFLGNTKTNDNVIRREFTISEGDIYDIDKIRRSIQKVMNLQYFKDVKIKEKQVSDDKIDLEVTVIEDRTNFISFSIGYDLASSVSGNVSFNETNLLGKGLGLSIAVEKGRFDQSFKVAFREPYLFGRDFALTTSAGYASQHNQALNAFKSETHFGSISGSYGLSENLRHSVTYLLKDDKLRIIDPKYRDVPTLKLQEGLFVTSSIGHSFAYDKRDRAFLPQEGYLLTFSQTLAGIGGNTNYLENEAMGEIHFQTFDIEDLVLTFRGKASAVSGYGGKKVPINARYNLGPSNGLRGFDHAGVGPKVSFSGSEPFAYGGTRQVIGNIEYRFPNPFPKEFNFTTFLFYDIGTVYGSEAIPTGLKILDSKSFRTSFGIGLTWRSPIGVLSISYARPLKKESFDEKRYFYLHIGGFSF